MSAKHLPLLTVIGTRQNSSVHSDSGTHSPSYRLWVCVRNWVGVVTGGNAIASEPRFQVAGGLYW